MREVLKFLQIVLPKKGKAVVLVSCGHFFYSINVIAGVNSYAIHQNYPEVNKNSRVEFVKQNNS